MGVDWYACPVCGEDCGYMVWCECGRTWCSDKCAEADGFVQYPEDDSDLISCKYCRKEDVEDLELLLMSLELLKINRKQAVELYFTKELK